MTKKSMVADDLAKVARNMPFECLALENDAPLGVHSQDRQTTP